MARKLFTSRSKRRHLQKLGNTAQGAFDFVNSPPEDLVFFRSGDTATYLNALGKWQQADENTPRYHYDENGSGLGLLNEIPVTNKNTNVNCNPTDTTNLTLAGDAGAVLSVVDAPANMLENAGLDEICTNGKVFYLDNSAGTGNAWVDLGGESGNTNPHSGSVFVAGAVSGYVGSFAIVGAAGNVSINLQDMTRAKLENTAPNHTSRKMRITASAGKGIYFILNQYEERHACSTPIITNGAAVTRGAEYGYLDGVEEWLNGDNGSLLLDATFNDVGNGDQTVLLAGDATDGIGMCIKNTTGFLRGIDAISSTDHQDVDIYTPVNGDDFKASMSWDASESTVVTYPMTYNTATRAGSRGSITRLYIGGLSSGENFDGYIRGITFRKVTKTLAEMGQEIFGHAVKTPPVLSGSTRIYTFSYVTGGQYKVVCDDAAVADVTKSLTEYITINGSNSINCILVFPDQFMFAGVNVTNFKSVIVDSKGLGSHIKGLVYASDANRALLSTRYNQGDCYVNNTLFDSNYQYGLDGWIFGRGSWQSIDPNYMGQNCKFQNIYNQQNDYIVDGVEIDLHADGVQQYGGYKDLDLMNVNVFTSTQGLFLTSQTNYAENTTYYNVAVGVDDPDTCTDYPVTIWESSQTYHPTITATNFYVDERTRLGNPFGVATGDLFKTYSVMPRAGLTVGAVEAVTGVLTFPDLDGSSGRSLFVGQINKRNGETFFPPLLGTAGSYVAPNAPTGVSATDDTGGFTVDWTVPTSNSSDHWAYLVRWKRDTPRVDANGEDWDNDLIGWEQEIIEDPAAITMSRTSVIADDYTVRIYAIGEFFLSPVVETTVTVT